jgi:hypothetical protein
MATTVDDCSDRLHAAGWSVGESCFRTNAGLVWQVDGANGEKRFLVTALTHSYRIALVP